MKPNQEHLIAAAMLCDSQQLLHAVEPRFSREIVGDVFEGDRLNRIHHDVPVVHWVTATNLHMRALPDPYSAPDPAAPDFFAKMFGEYHGFDLARSALVLRHEPGEGFQVEISTSYCSASRSIACIRRRIFLVVFTFLMVMSL